jgi:hypothetical protein
VLLGEFGSTLATASDQAWYAKMVSYLKGDLDGNGTNDLTAGQQGISWTYWSWNPNSGDTGGILADDWKTVNTAKVDPLKAVQFQFPAVTGTGGAVTTTPMTFTVSLSAASTQSVTVQYATADGTAVVGAGVGARVVPGSVGAGDVGLNVGVAVEGVAVVGLSVVGLSVVGLSVVGLSVVGLSVGVEVTHSELHSG